MEAGATNVIVSARANKLAATLTFCRGDGSI